MLPSHTDHEPEDFEAAEDVPSNASANTTIAEVVAERLSRRDMLWGTALLAVAGWTDTPDANAQQPQANTTPSFQFKEVAALVDEHHAVADGYDAQVLIRWGDPVLPGAEAFDAMAQTGAKQALQFGYNNDYLGYFPMPGASGPSRHGLLVVNHEYTSSELMHPAVPSGAARKDLPVEETARLSVIEMMAHGGSVLEVRRATGGQWSVVEGSTYARRITVETPMDVTGPAAGDARMQTPEDPTGRRVKGMFNNCAGGMTPWGTWLTCEENINFYFRGSVPAGHREADIQKRFGVGVVRYDWGRVHPRFDLAVAPHEINRFGWVVEIDPFDPASTPRKRTALGRFKHEGAAGITNKDGRYVVYMGDDQRFEYIYRFVTRGKVDPANRAANRDLLDDGELSVARYNADGTLDWLPLVFGQGPLTAANGFRSQGDVVIDARLAADRVGATKMDRPEDVEVNPLTGRVYAVLTSNNQRSANEVNVANPRAKNLHGHIIEMTPIDGDHAGPGMTWEFLVKCGDPSVASVGATFNPRTSKDGWFGTPDNVAIDALGRLWVSTDGNSDATTGRNDGLWAMETTGAARGTSKLFFRCPVGAELCGPMPTPDGETMFLAVQHPGEDGHEWKAFGRRSTFADPPTRWPDFRPGVPPRPSIVVVIKKGGGKIAV